MRIPARYAPLLFSALLSAIMVSIVSGFVLITTHGLTPQLPAQWLRSCLTTWPVAFAAVFVVAPQVRRVVNRLTAAAALMLLGTTAVAAQAQDAPRSEWRFQVASGALLPTGAQRTAIARGGFTAAQLSYAPGAVAVTATFGWARSRDIASPGSPKLDAFFYDVGAEYRATRVSLGAVSLAPFGGIGAGGRGYNYRSLEVDATHNAAAFLSVGGELGMGRVRLRVEVRDYLTGFRPLSGQGTSSTRNDLVVMAGLRLAPRQ